eukprot:2569269-Rhodomonas_salina.1
MSGTVLVYDATLYSVLSWCMMLRCIRYWPGVMLRVFGTDLAYAATRQARATPTCAAGEGGRGGRGGEGGGRWRSFQAKERQATRPGTRGDLEDLLGYLAYLFDRVPSGCDLVVTQPESDLA